MSRFALGYDIGRFTGACAASGEPLPAGTPCVTALIEAVAAPVAEGTTSEPRRPEALLGLARRDYSIAAWEAGHRPEGLFSWWRTTAPEPDAPRRLLVDDQTLLDIFARLEGDERPERMAFRFVLALALLRRKLLRSVGREREGGTPGREVWLLQPRGAVEGAPPMRVVDPGIGEADLVAVTEQVGQIVQGDAA